MWEGLITLTRLGIPGLIAAIVLGIFKYRKEIKELTLNLELFKAQKDKDLELERISGINEVNLIREQREYSIALNKIKIENELKSKDLDVKLAEIEHAANQNFYDYSRTLANQQNTLTNQQMDLASKIGGWVEVVNALIRPTISICILILIIVISGIYIDTAKDLSEVLIKNGDYKTVLEIGKTIFNTGFFLDIRSAFSNILTFWFGERATYKMLKNSK